MEFMTNTDIVYGAYAGQRTNAGAPSNGTSEVQGITIGGTPTGGSFKIANAAGRWSAAINWTATDATLVADLQTELDALFGSGNTTAAAGTLSSGIGTINITYGGDLASLNVPAIQVASSLTGTSPTLATTTPTPGVTATHRGAPSGATVMDTTDGTVYINNGTAPAPDWVVITTA